MLIIEFIINEYLKNWFFGMAAIRHVISMALHLFLKMDENGES